MAKFGSSSKQLDAVFDRVSELSKIQRIMICVGVFIIIFVLVVIILAYFAFKSQKEDEVNPPREEDEILKELGFYIKKHKRVTQKELRLQFHYSESAVSMAISQLESEGYLKKIKKGRGNIIVWIPKKSRKDIKSDETQKH